TIHEIWPEVEMKVRTSWGGVPTRKLKEGHVPSSPSIDVALAAAPGKSFSWGRVLKYQYCDGSTEMGKSSDHRKDEEQLTPPGTGTKA
ncbi:MAG: hypothetical protein Q9180_002443, partial [Flavoplaca navasiana]